MNPSDQVPAKLRDAAASKVIAGTHAYKVGTVRAINVSKTRIHHEHRRSNEPRQLLDARKKNVVI